jgi:hypothetical protein
MLLKPPLKFKIQSMRSILHGPWCAGLLPIALAITLTFSIQSWGQGILIGSGAHLVAQGEVSIVLQNAGFTNNGTFTSGSSTFRFTGNNITSGSFLSGSNSISLYNLMLDKTANGIQLNRDISVSNLVSFNSGDSIFLNNQVIDLGSTGSLFNESNSSHITGRTGGYVQITQSLNAPSLAAPGNLGLEITSGSNLGSTVIRRGHKQQGGISIFRYYDIIPTNNTALNAQLICNYFDSELAGIGEGNLAFFESFNAGVGYTNLGLDNLDISTNTITKNNVDQLARFTLSNIALPLAVTLLDIKAKLAGEDVLLNWSTASETDFSHFIVERSIDLLNFRDIGRVNSAGNGLGSSVSYYNFTDRNVPVGILYYRLKMIDIDGQTKFSKTLRITVDRSVKLTLSTYPNPANTVLSLRLLAQKAGSGSITIFALDGGKVYIAECKFIPGVNEFTIDIRQLANAFYQVKLVTSNGVIISGFIKN